MLSRRPSALPVPVTWARDAGATVQGKPGKGRCTNSEKAQSWRVPTTDLWLFAWLHTACSPDSLSRSFEEAA